MSVAEGFDMRNQLLKATLLPLLLTSACGLSSTGSSDDQLHTGGGDDQSDDGNSCDACGGGGGDDSGGGDSGGGGGVDVNVDLDLAATLDVTLVGSGIYVGIFPLGCLDLSGDFAAHAKATASFDGDANAWLVATVDANTSIDIGSGCSCSGIDINALAAINVNASLDANINSCHKACNGHGAACESACDQDGNTIVAHAALDANACASVSVSGDLDLQALVGLTLNLELDAVVDINGNVVVDL
jgi:hypothetical protein